MKKNWIKIPFIYFCFEINCDKAKRVLKSAKYRSFIRIKTEKIYSCSNMDCKCRNESLKDEINRARN